MFLDILLGIIWATLTSLFFDVTLSPLWILLGILFALLPDIDFWIEYLRRGTVGGKTLGDHRVLTHIPLLFFPLGLFLLLSFGTPLATLFFLGVIGHFVHDSHGMGYGYRIFYPFSPFFYKFFSDKEGNISYQRAHFLVRWSEREVRELHQKYGNDNWLRDDIQYHRHHWKKYLSQFLLLSILLGLMFIFSSSL